MSSEEYKEMFISESREHLAVLNQAMLELERNPENTEVINEIFRSAHTLKGMSATMGYENISELSHRMESMLDKIRQGSMSVTPDFIDTLFDCLDLLENMVEAVAENETKEIDASQVMAELDSILAEELNILTASARNGLSAFKIDVELYPECALKSVRAFMVFKGLGEIGEIFKCFPDAEKIEDGDFDFSFSVYLLTKENEKTIGKILQKISEIKKVDISPVEAKKEESKGTVAKKKIKSVQSIRVPIERLDLLMNLVGELVIGKSRLSQIGSKHEIEELNEALSNLNRLSNELQYAVTQMRMVEVSFVFDRFPRMVRDLAKNEGKLVDLVIEGKDIELDRTVLDEIGDPLVHLLRNCIDHGIETPEERKKTGKPERGTIRLAAKREKNHVEISVEDDGRGIDPEKIKKIAVKKGIRGEAEVKKMDNYEAMMLIFAPGFSSAEKVTDVSGRGVGMDVVRSKITALGGTVDVKSKVGAGTKAALRLPLTLAIIQALLVSANEETYAIPLGNVVETLKINKKEVKSIVGGEVIQLRGKVLPLVRLRSALGMPANNSSDSFPVVVVEKDGRPFGLAVESLIGQQEVVIKTLDKSLQKTKCLAGATILGDGRVALILDIASLIRGGYYEKIE